MQRFNEWLKAIFQEKINIFVKGFFGGGTISGIFLFGSSFHSISSMLLEGAVKLLVAGIAGVASGCATVLGNDMAKWLKLKWKRFVKKKDQTKSKNNKAA